jgi:DNA-binding NtrC family response regulator
VSSAGRVLIVDDDLEIRKTFAALLRDAGYVVDTAENGKEAIEKSNSNSYNLALIDIRLPDMEGTLLLTALKETIPKMVKIIVTGYPSLQNAVAAVNKGADGYIIKPAQTEGLLQIVKEQLRKQREEKEYGEERIKGFIESRQRELNSKEQR